jgi:DNA-3-methyladenine glycosylase I
LETIIVGIAMSNIFSPTHYRQIFFNIEGTLRTLSSNFSHFEDFKNINNKSLPTDNAVFKKIVGIVFYSGMNAATVTKRLDAIYEYLGDCEKATRLDPKIMLRDDRVIRHKGKIHGCIANAKEFENIINQYGSFINYLHSFGNLEDLEVLDMIKSDFENKFAYIGKVTAYHLMTDLGLNVLKPDRVICRIFQRLGFIQDEDDLTGAVEVGREIAEATKLPIRYVDIIFVKYGQKGSEKGFGLKDGICLDNPKCGQCSITRYCNYYNKKGSLPTRIDKQRAKRSIVVGGSQRGTDAGTCPKCGGKLVWRKARKTGELYRGCTNFQKGCRWQDRSY